MAGHGDESSPQLIQVHRQAAGGLGGIQNQRYAPSGAQGGDLGHRQHIAKDVGDMVAYDCGDLRGQQPLELVQDGLRLKQGRGGHLHLDVWDCGQRPRDGVVLVAGNQHGVPRLDQGLNGDVEPMGGVEGQYHIVGLPHVKQLRRRLAAGEGGLRGQHGRLVSAPSGRGHVVDRIGAGTGHGGRFLQRGSGGVQVDHRSTSR